MSVRNSKTKSRIICVALAGAVLMLGCAPSDKSNTRPTRSAIPGDVISQTPPAPAPGTSGTPNLDVSGIAGNVWGVLRGTYTGTLNKMLDDGTVLSQQYSVNLLEATSSSKVYPYLVFQSSGEIGSFNFASYLNLGANGYPANGVQFYGFMSSVQSIPSLTYVDFAIELILSVRNGNQIDPTQSAIFIKDCGFSQGAATPICSSDAYDVWFGSDLGKR